MNKEIRKTALFRVVKDIIDECDCEHLLSSGAPEDEYDRESERIAERLRPDMTMPQIAEVIKNEMNSSFAVGYDSEDGRISYYPGFSAEDFYDAATDIYESFLELIELRQDPPAFRETIPEEKNTLPDCNEIPGLAADLVINGRAAKRRTPMFKRKVLPQLPAEYDRNYIVDSGTIKLSVLRRSGYRILHRPYFAMKDSTHDKWQLNPHQKTGVDAANTDAPAMNFKEYLKLFE